MSQVRRKRSNLTSSFKESQVRYKSSPTDLIFIDVQVLYYREINQGEKVLYLLPLKRGKLAQCILEDDSEEHLVSKFNFKPEALFDELPLPHQNAEVSVRDYPSSEFMQLRKEINHWVKQEGSDHFVSPHHSLKILAGDENTSEVQLALLAKTLSTVPPEVWHDSKRIGKFPGIPEEDVAIRILLKTTATIQYKVRRLNIKLHQCCREQLQKEMDIGIIEDSTFPYAFPIICVEKKTGKLRVCGDYRILNEVAVPDYYPLSLIEYLIALVKGAKFLSLFDLSSRFQQLHIYKPHRERLAIITPFGIYQPVRLPYGYLNGPPIFQREYDRTVGSMLNWGRAFIDDLTLYDPNNQRSHDMKVATVLHNIHKRGMVVNQEKTVLLKSSLPYLGIMNSGEGIKAMLKHNAFDLLMEKKHRNLLSL